MFSLGHRSFSAHDSNSVLQLSQRVTFILYGLLYALFYKCINSRRLRSVHVFVHGYQKSVVVLLLCALASMGLRWQGCAQILKFFQGVGRLLLLLLFRIS